MVSVQRVHWIFLFLLQRGARCLISNYFLLITSGNNAILDALSYVNSGKSPHCECGLHCISVLLVCCGEFPGTQAPELGSLLAKLRGDPALTLDFLRAVVGTVIPLGRQLIT